MATLSYGDLLKRDNVSVFVNRVNQSGSFNERTESGDLLVCTGNAKMKHEAINGNVKLTEELVRMFLNTKKNTDYIEVECYKNNSKRYLKLTIFFKDKEFGGVASKSSGGGSERQELGLIDAINETVRKTDQSWVQGIGRSQYLKGASKREGLSSIGQEPYIDVYVEAGRNKYGISCKGESAPSLAGGGIAGLKVVAPDLIRKLYASIENYLKTKGMTEGSIVDAGDIPDFFIEIPNNYVEKILVGNERMGGPIDYMYVGKMDVVSSHDERTNELKLNGDFYSIDEYMRKIGKFYFRIRKRDLPTDNKIMISFKTKNKEGFPIVFKSPKSNKNHFRLVITDKISGKGTTLEL